MKTPLIYWMRFLIIFIFFMTASVIVADPPDPGGAPGDPPMGGGAPIGDGISVLLIAGTIYILFLFRKFFYETFALNNTTVNK